jgi:hypothetical protein
VIRHEHATSEDRDMAALLQKYASDKIITVAEFSDLVDCYRLPSARARADAWIAKNSEQQKAARMGGPQILQRFIRKLMVADLFAGQLSDE